MKESLTDEEFRELSNDELIAALDTETILLDEVYIRIFEFESQIEKTRYIARVRHKAQKIGMQKAFDDMLRTFQADYISKTKDGVYNTVDFTDCPVVALRCGAWAATDKGISKENTGTACTHPILPIERLYNLDLETEKLKLAFFKDKHWQYVTVDRSVCADKSAIVKNLANRGIEVTSKNAAALVEYISDVVTLNPYDIPRHDSVSRMGWITPKKFMPYEESVQYDGDQAFTGLYDAITQKGDFDEWVAYCTRLRSESLYLRLQMAASFASPLIEKVQALPFIFHLWGGTGTGKTVGLMTAMSIWGNPRVGKLVRTMDMTANNMALIASFLNSLPFAGDELQIIKRRWGQNYDDIVMFLCEGVDRGRNTSRSTSERLKTWNNAFLFTGEEPITKSNSGGGVKNRVIEAYVEDKVVSNGNAVVSFVTDNYGLAGPEFIRYLQKTDVKDLRKRYNGIFKALLCQYDATEKQAMSLTLMLLADEIAREIIFITEEPIPMELLGAFLVSEKEVDTSERAYDYIVDLVSRNLNRFSFDENNRGEIWGKIEDGIAVINRYVLQEQLEKGGFDMTATLKKLDAKGKLIRSSQGRFTHQTRVFGQKANYIKIKIDAETEAVSEADLDFPF